MACKQALKPLLAMLLGYEISDCGLFVDTGYCLPAGALSKASAGGDTGHWINFLISGDLRLFLRESARKILGLRITNFRISNKFTACVPS
jgi:hypothetical protein